MTRATRQPNNEMIIALQDVTFTCTAKGYEVEYEWRHHKNNSIIGRGSTYTISEATPLDEDQYYCVAMTEGGYDFSNNVTLRVYGENNNFIDLVSFTHFTESNMYKCTSV